MMTGQQLRRLHFRFERSGTGRDRRETRRGFAVSWSFIGGSSLATLVRASLRIRWRPLARASDSPGQERVIGPCEECVYEKAAKADNNDPFRLL